MQQQQILTTAAQSLVLAMAYLPTALISVQKTPLPVSLCTTRSFAVLLLGR
jgi:hypothetical protein